jgi:serine phosphatase RsbU (regulator of sigma subunit)
MLLYTDGLVEARDPAGEFFPLVDHADVLAGRSVHDSLAHLVERLARHKTTRLADDLALLLIENSRSSGESPAGTVGPTAVPIAR